MTMTAIIREINKLSLNERLSLVETTLKSIRLEKETAIERGVQALYDDYKMDKELTVFTNIDAASFYEPR